MPPHRPPPFLQSLPTLSAAQLNALAIAIGAPSSGTKSIVSSRLQSALKTPKLSSAPIEDVTRLPVRKANVPNSTDGTGRPSHTIISIDMGIRNLAYCRIALPASWPSPSATALPVVEEWTRFAIAAKAIARKSTANDANAEEVAKAKSGGKAKEPFDPQTYAAYAHNLVTSLLSHPASPPTDILIERQRFRSGGGSAVQEWTLRVNMFEGMLWAVLKALWAGSVWAVEPARVARFWCAEKELSEKGVEKEVEKGKSRKGMAAKTKEEKIMIVERWLKEGGVVETSGTAKATAEAYLAKRANNGRKGRDAAGEEVEKLGKLDDLADCLLQGMAWVKWEENRRKILEHGVHALEEAE